jgi:pimeloyl-ACP methyl ester carboxylesterase
MPMSEHRPYAALRAVLSCPAERERLWCLALAEDGSSRLKLHTREWGTGDRVAVLVHGMMGESRQFWEVGPALADRGFRVIAVDLPGHGHSGPCLSGGLGAFAERLVASVPGKPELALGHSLGAMVVAAAVPRLQPGHVVYVDVPFQPPDTVGPRQDGAALTASFEELRADRTAARLAKTRPWWKSRDCEVEEEAARLFDVPTAVALQLATAGQPVTAPSTSVPSLLIHADPSSFVSSQRIAELRALGFEVRGVEGAGHSVWYGFFDEFMATLDDWLSEQATH